MKEKAMETLKEEEIENGKVDEMEKRKNRRNGKDE